MIHILRLLILLAAAVLPSAVFAQTGSVPVALKAVQEFYTETDALTRDLDSGPKRDEAQKALAANRDSAVKEIHSIDWVEAPGKRRFKKIYAVVEAYLDAQIDLTQKFAKDLPAGKNEEPLKKLSASKDAKLKALTESSSAEAREERKEKPNPVIDRSPYETSPGTDKGIWER